MCQKSASFAFFGAISEGIRWGRCQKSVSFVLVLHAVVQSSKFKVQSSKFKVQSSKFKVQSSKFKVQSSKFKVQSDTGLVLHLASIRVEAFVPFVSFVVLENHLANIYLGRGLSKGYAG